MLFIYVFMALAPVNFARSEQPLLEIMCERFGKPEYCRPNAESIDELPVIEKQNLSRAHYCQFFRGKFYFFCNSTQNAQKNNNPSTKEFCRRFLIDCGHIVSLVEGPLEFSDIQASRYCLVVEKEAQAYCAVGKIDSAMRQRCKAYKTRCLLPPAASTSQPSDASGFGVPPALISSNAPRNSAPATRVRFSSPELQRTYDCVSNLEAFDQRCRQKGGGRQRRQIVNAAGFGGTADGSGGGGGAQKACGLYTPAADALCATGAEMSAMNSVKIFCDFHRSYCTHVSLRQSRDFAPHGNTDEADAVANQPNFCESYVKMCNSRQVFDAQRLLVCLKFEKTENIYCPGLPLAQQRIGCAKYRKYCMENAPQFLNIDGVEI